MLSFIADLYNAHRRTIHAAITAFLIQYVDQATVDWVITGVGLLAVFAFPNDERAKRRFYRR